MEDDCTKFFHEEMSTRRHMNMDSLLNQDISSHTSLYPKAVDFCKELYNGDMLSNEFQILFVKSSELQWRVFSKQSY